MANETIYPFGLGSLPAGYPIADDLNTNRGDIPLSAKQGKIIGDYILGRYVSVDLSSITTTAHSLGSSGWGANGEHKVISVTPGQKVKFSVLTSQDTGAWYTFLTSSYTTPSTSDTIPYVAGYTRTWLETGNTVEVTVPNNAAYLCICPKDGNNKVSTWSVQTYVVEGMRADYVDDNSEKIKAYVTIPVDVSAITESICSLGASSWLYKTNQKQRHKVVEVTPGLKIRVRATASTDGGNFRAFLTSSYTPPSANGDPLPYVPSTGREWQLDSSGWVELTCPPKSAYLCLVTVNGDNDTTVWDVVKKPDIPIREALEDYALTEDKIVNNLNDGGADVPLSAEMGKTLYHLVSDGIPNGITKYEYNGAAVKISMKHYVGRNKVATIGSQSFQGGACFGDFLFMFTEGNTTCWIYNLATSTLVQTISIPSADRGFVATCHCNTVNFGTEKYDEGDTFPLIYVSTGYNDGTDTGAIVYRIVETTEDDVTTYSLQLVQTLKMPGTGWTEFVVGDDGCCYLCYTTPRIIYRMKMPTLSQGDITFDLSQALDTYRFSPQPAWYNGSRNQGRIFHNGKIYLTSGVPSSSETSLFISLNLATQTRDVEIDLANTLGLTAESEAIFIWGGRLCVAFRNHINVYALYFE